MADDKNIRVGKDGRVYRHMRKLYANQDIYEGEFVDGLRHGRGAMTYSSGDRYTGEFETELFHGYGVYIWKAYFDDDGNYIAGKRYDGKQALPICLLCLV